MGKSGVVKHYTWGGNAQELSCWVASNGDSIFDIFSVSLIIYGKDKVKFLEGNKFFDLGWVITYTNGSYNAVPESTFRKTTNT